MSAAQGFYEVYKALPKKVQKEVKLLIENDEIVETIVKTIEQGLKEVKQIRDGKLPLKTFAELKKEMANEK